MLSTKHLTLFVAACAFVLAQPGHAATVESPQPREQNMLGIVKRDNISVVYDVKDDVWEAGVGRALYFVRGLIESYQAMGVSPGKLHISIVMHGPTAYWLLNEEAYRKHKEDPFDFNPNEHIVQELLKLGVSVEICNFTMKTKGWTGKDLLPGITIVHDAYTRMIDLQLRNYAYIRF
jgi:intracellular sulfur oxidation DsrE/DsrF family protein